ncbi:MAG: bifunctional riboflavin kinase/FAD synthetase [Gammaproteobacteria bacterium]|nr:bifunctional riboflavin kinase/FAD synthetase [Gammaproteobacteria bacterium]MDH5304204.1 bifunctional riboflavin kinase/FAD synthetase [Gammaproteobacteria bacterium]MDH5322898.1 bifunctional riboflavin kinase/FAD synthetase [Gammaproteobacteria bacterium]
MQLVRHLDDLPYHELQDGTVVSIGAYDGLHLGHQQLLASVRKASNKTGLPSVIMSFEPMPREFFAPQRPTARLMRFREKFEALAQQDIDYFYCPRFDANMRDISAPDFIRRILVHGLGARHIVVGDDFRFARRREGHVEQLQMAGRALEFDVEQLPSVIVDGVRVSSTAIRNALWLGDMQTARTLLGRYYCMSGTVIRGEKVGRTLGFPTANVDLRRRQSPVMGIFAVRVRGLGASALHAVASVGTRPTFNGVKPLLEVHIFDFDEEIYGAYIHIEFISRLRSEIKYDDIEELVAQMHRDADNARSILATTAA